MKIQLIFVGKNKDQWLETALADFLHKLKFYAEIQIDFVKDEPITKGMSAEKIKQIEGERILGLIPKGNFKLVLDERGKLLDSLKFAEFLGKRIDLGQNLSCVIGGALGLAAEVKTQADLLWALSPLTLTHQLARVVLCEQLYRGFNILKGTEYHK